MKTFEPIIQRQPRDLINPLDDPTILLLKQRRAKVATMFRDSHELGMTAEDAYTATHRLSLDELGLTPEQIEHIQALTPRDSGRSPEEIAKIQGRLGLRGEPLN